MRAILQDGYGSVDDLRLGEVTCGGSFAAPDKLRLMGTRAQLLGTGQLTVVIDRTSPLAQASAALRNLASGQALGRVVIVVDD